MASLSVTKTKIHDFFFFFNGNGRSHRFPPEFIKNKAILQDELRAYKSQIRNTMQLEKLNRGTK